MIIGIDDTDSRAGMCTTYLCAVLVDELQVYGEVSTPRLVRLNPCIPFKTRGNGAVSFELKVSSERAETVKELVKSRVRELSEVQVEGTNPGVVFIDNAALHALSDSDGKSAHTLKDFYETAVRDVVKLKHAYELIAELQLDYFGLKNKRGLIGALAAAAFLTVQTREPAYYDFTYELIAYREKERWGTLRLIDDASVWNADAANYPLTWDTVDRANKKVVCAPHSPCPVLFGIRGDSVDALYNTRERIQAEPAEREMLFVTNQGTDSHLITVREEINGALDDYHSHILDGVVESDPRTIMGGHAVFALALTLTDPRKQTARIDCIAYEPTKNFRDIIRKLRLGDEVTVYGSFKDRTLNLEKIELRKLNVKVERNPRCAQCGKRMESAGKSQGYRCKRCKTYSTEKEVQIVERDIEAGLYEVPPVARRHISKPLIRLRTQGEVDTIHPSR
jgi:tRNA(Ile2)-agmatinylcytidine synthase